MTKGQKKMLVRMSAELESYDNIMRLLTDKVFWMEEKVKDSFTENPPADDKEKEYVDELLEEMQQFIDQNAAALLSLRDLTEVD